jgi:uncharacterized protein YbaP (TraB family)
LEYTLNKNALLLLALLIVACTVPQKLQTCIDTNTNTYTNDYVGFSLNLPNEWIIGDSRQNAPGEGLKDQLPVTRKANDISPLFVAMKGKNPVFIRCLIEKTSMDVEDYFTLIYDVNKSGISDAYDVTRSKDRRAIRWKYEINNGGLVYSFDEAVIKMDAHIIRLGLWTMKPLFSKYTGEFDDILEKFKVRQDSAYSICWETVDSSFEDVNFSFIKKRTSSQNTPVALCDSGSHPLLYKVTKDTSAVYLFGSIHFGNEHFYPLHEKIEQAFEKSKSLIVEVNTEDDSFNTQSQAFAKEMMLPDGKTLKNMLSAPLYKKLEQAINGYGLTIDKFNKMQPWVIAISLSAFQLQSAGYVADYGIDKYFINKAQKNKKNIISLETITQQMNLLQSFNEEDFLAYTILESSTNKARMHKLSQNWLCGKEEELIADVLKDYSSDIVKYKELHDNMITKRNITMTSGVESYLKKGGAYFLVVGTAHIVGKGGIVDLLKNKGYKVEKL